MNNDKNNESYNFKNKRKNIFCLIFYKKKLRLRIYNLVRFSKSLSTLLKYKSRLDRM